MPDLERAAVVIQVVARGRITLILVRPTLDDASLLVPAYRTIQGAELWQAQTVTAPDEWRTLAREAFLEAFPFALPLSPYGQAR